MELSVKNSTLLLLTICSSVLAISGFYIWRQTNANMLNVSTNYYATKNINVNASVLGKSIPVIDATNQKIALNASFDALNSVTAHDQQDGDISHNLQVFENVDTSKKGEYFVRYTVRNSYGLKSEKRIRVLVD